MSAQILSVRLPLTRATALRVVGRAAACVCIALLSGCGTSAGGGGGVLAVGGQPGSPCDSNVHNQGCNGLMKVTCESTSNTWTAAGNCAGGEVCITKPDPADATNFKKLSSCIALATGTDAGTTDAGLVTDATAQGDAQATGDGAGTGDSGPTSSDAAMTDATTGDAGTTTDTGSGPVGGPWLACVTKNCAAQWGACSASAACKTAGHCMDSCGDDKKCRQLCFDNTGEGAQDQLISLIMCADQTECVAGPAGPKCGDGKCEAGESPITCALDCKTTGPQCGNGKCEEGESSATCPADCKPATPQCGDGKCETGETPQSCLADCKPTCGDGKCELGESKNTCPQDCGAATVCGNGVCEPGETASSCAKDCGVKPTCGNGKCETGETASSCAKDCGGGGECVATKCATLYNGCISSSKCLGIIYFAIVNGCISDNNCQDNACVTSKCGKQASDCQQDTGCNAVLGCLNQCTTKTCQDQCFDQTAMTQYENLGKCAQTNCPNG